MKKKFTVTADADALKLLAGAAEMKARLCLGQLDELVDLLISGNLLPLNGMQASVEQIQTVRAYIEGICRVLGFSPGQSHGILSGKVPESVKELWMLHKIITRAVSWQRAVEEGLIKSLDSPRDFSSMMGVNYDDPLLVASAKPEFDVNVKRDDAQSIPWDVTVLVWLKEAQNPVPATRSDGYVDVVDPYGNETGDHYPLAQVTHWLAM